MDVANARYDNIDMGLPIVGQMFGGLQAAGLLTAEQVTELLTMGTQPDPVTYLQCGDAIEQGV